MLSRETISLAYEDACLAEIDALKPGNVHRFADGHRMFASQFLESARVSSGPLTDPGLSTGLRILEAVRVTREAVGTNTNLGIVLLCAPLARAVEIDSSNPRVAVAEVVRSMDVADTEAVFQAIVLAEPGGLGSSDTHDVREKPKVPLVEAMREAAGRDMIARQYVTEFEDVFQTGVGTLAAALDRGESGMWPAVLAYLQFLAVFPDSHISRKYGPDVAGRVQEEAGGIRSRLENTSDERGRIGLLLEFDRSLKERELNPGTTADLTVASLFAQRMSTSLQVGTVGA
jgi:triphosphoribosyl-dephospho-CoA synthase